MWDVERGVGDFPHPGEPLDVKRIIRDEGPQREAFGGEGRLIENDSRLYVCPHRSILYISRQG